MRELELTEIESVSGGIVDSQVDTLLNPLATVGKWLADAAAAVGLSHVLDQVISATGTINNVIFVNNVADPNFQIGAGTDYEDIYTDPDGTTGYWDEDAGILKLDFDNDGLGDAYQLGNAQSGFGPIIYR